MWLARLSRSAAEYSGSTGDNIRPEITRAARIEIRLAIAPTSGPPPIWPIASTWLRVENIVART